MTIRGVLSRGKTKPIYFVLSTAFCGLRWMIHEMENQTVDSSNPWGYGIAEFGLLVLDFAL